jgi:hypothetical protein
MMRLRQSLVTSPFKKITDFSETLIRSAFRMVLTAFEAYGTALCGHVPTACPYEADPRPVETRPDSVSLPEPQTKTFAIVRNRSNRKVAQVPQCQL